MNAFSSISVLCLIMQLILAAPAAAAGFVQAGEASWYGSAFHGQTTASGETYNMYELTAAHKFLPLGSKVKVTNQDNGKNLVVRINDRGPYIKGRIIDLSKAAARELGMHDSGTALVRIETVDTPVGVTSAGDVQGIFFVHLATFSGHDPAIKLFKRLQKHKSEPRLLQITDPEGVTAHVQLGPFTALSEANLALSSQENEFPEAYVMAELEGASLRSYLRANGHKKAAARLVARQQAMEQETQKKKAAAQKPKKSDAEKTTQKEAPPTLPEPPLQGLAPCGFPLQAGKEAGFFVQLAMYNLSDNAENLLEQLKPSENPLRIVRTNIGSRHTYMVQAGPFSSRNKARQAQRGYKNHYRDAFILPGARIEPENACILQALAGDTPHNDTRDESTENDPKNTSADTSEDSPEDTPADAPEDTSEDAPEDSPDENKLSKSKENA